VCQARAKLPSEPQATVWPSDQVGVPGGAGSRVA
jgi:hypothetical protein